MRLRFVTSADACVILWLEFNLLEHSAGEIKLSIKGKLRREQAHASNYETWYEVTRQLETQDGSTEWRDTDASPDYDYELISNRLNKVRGLRRKGELTALMHHLRQNLHWNSGNIGSPALYERSRLGTKFLIEDYLDEAAAALDFLCDNDFDEVSFEEKLKFFRETALSYGRSALMLSGGATLGMFHVGVVKAMWEQELIPEVLSGSSAGSIVAATLATRQPEDYEDLLNAEFLNQEFMLPVSPRKALQQQAAMEPERLRECLNKVMGELTFEESYARSGRVVNITVSPARSNQNPRLVNHLTFPHLLLNDAVMASCALPYLFPPTTLRTRTAEGEIEPFMGSCQWVDGSLKSDLPHLRLRRLHNVNHYIVSQTNPHVLPFVQDARDQRKTRFGDTREFLKSTTKFQISNTARLLGRFAPLGIGSRPLGNIHSVLEQDYRGNVTIVPPFRARDYLGLFTNPTTAMVEGLISEGEKATWPRLAMIRNQTRISRCLAACVRRLETRAAEQVPPALSEAVRSVG